MILPINYIYSEESFLTNSCILLCITSCGAVFRFTHYIVQKYQAYFVTRVPRQNKDSLSYFSLATLLFSPYSDVLKPWPTIKDDILDLSQRSIPDDSLSSHELVETVERRGQKIKESKKSLSSEEQDLTESKIITHFLSKKDLKLPSLNMDHVYLTLGQLFWAYLFVGLFSFFLYKKGIIKIRVRAVLVSIGFLQVKKFDARVVVAKLLLEQSLAIQYVSMEKRKTSKDTKRNAIFVFTRFPYIDNAGDFQIADLVTVKIDLDSKKMLSYHMNDEELTPSQAVIIIFFNLISAHHSKIHALANWGVNCDIEVKRINPQLYRNSIVTIMYNHAGYTGFPGFIDDRNWERSGLITTGWRSSSLKKVFDHGLDQQIWEHSQIVELLPYSELVNFIVKVRAFFHQTFSKHKHHFPGVDCEALFAGTVLHSLDHYFAECNIEDPLWLDVKDEKFGKMAEMGRIVRAGFVEDVPGLYFPRRFKDSGHPFYEAVYEKAAKVNKRLADKMDSCICK